MDHAEDRARYVNRWLGGLPDADLKEDQLRKVPASYRIKHIGSDKLRFVSRSRHLAEREAAEEYAEEQRLPVAAEADDDNEYDWFYEGIERRDAEKKRQRQQQAAEDDDGTDFEPVMARRFRWQA